MQFRQGDILLEFVGEEGVPEYLELVDDFEEEIIVSRGEKTGHSHRIRESGNAAQFSETGNRIDDESTQKTFVIIKDPVELIHEEHETVTLPEGTYVIHNQREYSPEGILPVID